MSKSYECLMCGYVYNERDGAPAHGLPEGTAWAEVPDEWPCPECGVTKLEFEERQEPA